MMYIQTETTPNPLTLKFLPGQEIMPDRVRFFQSSHEAPDAPMVQRLFGIEGVTAIFLGADFISVTKDEAVSWEVMRPFIFAVLIDHFLSGQPLIVEEASQGLMSVAASGATEENLDLLARKIRDLLEVRVRPAVALDGGDILFDRFEDGIVYVYLRGACSGCPSATLTLKAGVESMLRHYVPEVLEVRAV